MLYWKWPQFWKKWGSCKCVLKMKGLYKIIMRRVSNGSLLLDKIRTGCNNLFCSKNGIHLTLHWRPNYRTGAPKLYLICQGFEIHVQALLSRRYVLLKKIIYIVKQKFLALTRRHSLNKVSNWPFLKPHPWISQLSPNYNSAGSTASKGYVNLDFSVSFFYVIKLFLKTTSNDFFHKAHHLIAEIICVKNVRAISFN